MRTWPAIFATAVLFHAVTRAQDQPQKPPELVASSGPLEPEQEARAFHLPPGFEAQLVAREPDVHKPMNLAFDDRGRLWVTSSLEYPFPVRAGEQGRDAVVVLEDFGPDGRARKVTKFAEGLNIPIGVLPLSPNEALVHTIPTIRRYVDKDSDGVADDSSDAYVSIGYRDTHGMASHFTWGFDGWIYACHGYSNTSTLKGADGQAITMNSGNTFRMRADGSHVEQWTWGQVNPFGLVFDPLGNIFTCDCHSRPVYQILRGAYYPSFGKPHDGLGFGPEMMTHDHGSTGIGGIVYYAADGFPHSFRDNVFVGNVVTSRINRDRLDAHGSTLLGIAQPDFLVSDDPWFRPVDLSLGPDGAIYVADFYNRIIGHYEVPLTHPGRDRERGRIWRIIYTGNDVRATASRSDWTTASDDALLDDLGHPNLVVRTKATNLLVARGSDAALQKVATYVRAGKNAAARSHGLWVLERRGRLDQSLMDVATGDPDPLVRVHAMKVLAGRKTIEDANRALAVAGLFDRDAFVRRAAAEALGQHPDPQNIRPLLSLRQGTPADDTHLLHMARMALRNQLRTKSTWAALANLGLSERDERDLADVAPGVHTLESARFLVEHIRAVNEPLDKLVDYAHHSARYGDDTSTTELISALRAQSPSDDARAATLLRAVHQGVQERGGPLGGALLAWAEGTTGALLNSRKDADYVLGAELVGQLRLASSKTRLEAESANRQASETRRSAALVGLFAVDAGAGINRAGAILANPDEPIGLREQAATQLGRNGQTDSRDRLVAALPLAQGRLQTMIAAGLASQRAGAERLLDAIAAGKASARLLQDRAVQVPLKQARVPKLDERLATLLKDLPPAEDAVQALIQQRRASFDRARVDVAAGSKVFEKTCAPCHQLGGKGARVGPQLDGIGERGPDRLLEDILDPNRNVDQAFRSTMIASKDGKVLSGLLLREEGQILVLADAQGKEQRIDRDTVEDRKVAQVSPMPANLSQQISEADFNDLLAYLLTQKEARPGAPANGQPPAAP
jgi:putative heme-binding domain-containing protein